MPNEGWSMYASPETSRMSSSFQPRWFISCLVVGIQFGAVCELCVVSLGRMVGGIGVMCVNGKSVSIVLHNNS